MSDKKRTVEELQTLILETVPQKIREYEDHRKNSDAWNERWDALYAKAKVGHQRNRLLEVADRKIVLERAMTTEMENFNKEVQSAMKEYDEATRKADNQLEKRVNIATVVAIIAVALCMGYIIWMFFI